MNNGSSINVTITETVTGTSNVNLKVEVATNTSIDDAIIVYDITIGTNKSFTATVTIPATIPLGSIPTVISYNDDGSVLRSEKVVTWTSDSVTFITDHNTLFAVGSYVPVTEDPDDAYQQWLQQYYQQLAQQQQSQKTDDGLKKTVSVAIAAIAVIMLSVAALMVTRRK